MSSLIINCGASHISASTVSVQEKKLVIEQFIVQELDYDYSLDEDWLDAVAVALNDLMSHHKIRGMPTVIVPGFQLLTKPIKVPHVELAKRAQIIAFEAQQNIPYPLHEVIWDSQEIADDDVETDIILIAIKAAMVNRLCGHMASQGLAPQRVQAASMLAYPDFQEDTLLINIGARSTNLMFTSKSGVFVRTIAFAGNALTQSIADQMGIPFIQAEKIKIGYFSGQSRDEANQPDGSILEASAQSFKIKLNQEISRSIISFRRQRAAETPTHIVLTGRGSLLPDLVEHLSQTQKIPVDSFKLCDNLSWGSAIEASYAEQYMHNLSEVLGVACCIHQQNTLSINLLPAALANRVTFRRRKPILLTAAALLALSTIPPIMYYQSIAAGLSSQEARLVERIDFMQDIQVKIAEQQYDVRALQQQVTQLEELVDSKSNWPIFLSDLQARLLAVEDVWLDDLKWEDFTDKRLKLTGRLLIKDYDPDNPLTSAEQSYARVDQLLRSFSESQFVDEVTEPQFNPDTPRILTFDFILIQNPSHPL